MREVILKESRRIYAAQWYPPGDARRDVDAPPVGTMIGGVIKTGNVWRLTLSEFGHSESIRPGEWVVDDGGSYCVYEDADFQQRFEFIGEDKS